MLTSLAAGFYSFATFRFLLGAGESANWPAATKAVSEWFPKRERALATALFDSGSSIGGAIAPFIVLWIYFRWGWRPAFMVPGTLGFLWLIAWRWLYFPPESYSRISTSELAMIVADKRESDAPQEGKVRPRWSDLLKLPQTWGTIIARALQIPFFFYHGVVPDLSVCKGNRAQGRFDSSVDSDHRNSVYRSRCGQFLCRVALRPSDQARMVARQRAQIADYLRRNRHDAADSNHPHH